MTEMAMKTASNALHRIEQEKNNELRRENAELRDLFPRRYKRRDEA